MPIEQFKPTTADVGSLIRIRTKDEHGNEIGTFNSTTRPTADEVTPFIERAARRVAQSVGEDLPNATTIAMAKDLAALRAAAEVERTYFPEQIQREQSNYLQLVAQFEADMPVLAKAVAEAEFGDRMGSIDEPGKPSYSFPVDRGGMVGWQTRW